MFLALAAIEAVGLSGSLDQVVGACRSVSDAEMSKPTVSIVMPSFNQAAFIEESIQSVLTQHPASLELVVQDGGSNDGTCDVLKRIADSDPRLDWRSEPDTGPAQAINRALARSRGAIIGWLNSDDLYVPDAVQRAVDAFARSANTIMVYGQGHYIGEQGEFLSIYPTKVPGSDLDAFHSGCYICQPTVFFRRVMYEELGPLDETYKASFDFEYWLRAFSAFPKRIGFVDKVQAKSRLHDACITQSHRRTVAAEGVALTNAYLGSAQPHWVTTYLEELAEQLDDHCMGSEFEAAVDSFLSAVAHAYEDEEYSAMRRQVKAYLTVCGPR